MLITNEGKRVPRNAEFLRSRWTSVVRWQYFDIICWNGGCQRWVEYISVIIRKLIQWIKQYHPRLVNRKLRCLVTNGNHLRYKDEYSDHLLLQRSKWPYSLSQTFHGLSCYKSSFAGRWEVNLAGQPSTTTMLVSVHKTQVTMIKLFMKVEF